MSDDPTPTTARRQLGAQLRGLRLERGLTAHDVAEVLGFSVSKVSRIETGARAVSPEDIAALTDYFEVGDKVASGLRDLARSGKRRRAPAAFPAVADADPLKIVQTGFVDLERDADVVREFNSGVVPGLLQSREYMRSLIAAALPSDTVGIDKAIDLRVSRQQRLEVRRPYSVIIDEAVLARVVGGPSAMYRQVELIAKRVDEGSVDLKVVPFNAGAHPGLNSMFVSLSMGHGQIPDVVFLEGPAGHQKIDKPDDVDRFDRLWQQILDSTVSAESSRGILMEYCERYRRAQLGVED
jgi:transcriptional regulator with XRE-family HTH domain